MHFKRDLCLSMIGAVIIITAVLFSSKSSEASSDTKKSLPQINEMKEQSWLAVNKELDA